MILNTQTDLQASVEGVDQIMSEQPAAELQRINPFFLVDDVYASAEHYRDVFGFHFEQFWGEPPSFVMVRRDAIQIMLRQGTDPTRKLPRPNNTVAEHTFDAYVYVDDVDALYRELAGRGAKLLYEPCDQPHDCREFEAEDMNGYVLCFGQDLLR